MDKLKKLFEEIKEKNIPGLELEDFRIVKRVDYYRRIWKPEKVKILLLAESHVFTTIEESGEKNYVKFVYYPEYGEKQIWDTGKRHGTPQYWRIFTSCLGYDKNIIQGKNKTIENKIKILHELREKGIWLLDASIIAIDKKKHPIKEKVLELCSNFIIDIIINENPNKIIIIGAIVRKVMENKLEKLNKERLFLYQPEYRNNYKIYGSMDEYYNEYKRFCN